MPVITIFSGEFCLADAVAGKLAERTGYRRIGDGEIARKASAISHLGEDKIERAFSADTSIFNRFTHEKERSIARLRLATAEALAEDNLLIEGLVAQLVPKAVSHVLRVCVIAEMKFRVAAAKEAKEATEHEAAEHIHGLDAERAAWVNTINRRRDPWDPSLYDIIIPMDKMTVEEAVSLIEANLLSEILKPTDASRRAAADFKLAAEVETALAREGHNVTVTARDGSLNLTINRNVLMLGRLEEELREIAMKVPGVSAVETRIGKGFYRTDIYRKCDFTAPNLLLVDDEREFVQTLSERLLMRDRPSAIAYDGESALELVHRDEPEVMILDLKMPGIDGIEVLRKVKETQPDIEVIILTGHGSEKDRETCMGLGAFAYLQKPVDIDALGETLKRANEKIRLKKT